MSELPDDVGEVLAGLFAAQEYRRRERAAGRLVCVSMGCMELPGDAVALLDTGIAKHPICRACADELAPRGATILPLPSG